MRHLLISALALSLLSGCAGDPDDIRNRPLGPNPSAFIAAEIGFARLAQDKGQWTAFRETSAPEAVMFVPQRVKARDWLKSGGVIPKRFTLHRDLIGPETVPRMDGKIQLESKKDMKKRGIESPGEGDALALSFAFPVIAKHLQGIPGTQGRQTKEHNPYDNLTA